jgi:carbamoyl-phosphate synthase small subunit
VLGLDPDGVFLSNGPGDPAATAYGVEAAGQVLAAGVPTFGVCLGHQLMALALGATTSKLPFGHRGANHPVRDAETGRVLVTSHNHGFAVDPGSLREADGVAPTHWNLNDGTLEGFRCLDRPAFAVQFHPEAAPGPHDAVDLVHRFRRRMVDAAA